VEAQKRIDGQTTGISEEGGMEHMMVASAHSQFAKVLNAEQLLPIPSRFREADFCDEVPLYSRYKQVDFLKQCGDVDRLLLELSLEYLEMVKSERPARKSERFIAVTIFRDSVDEYIIPCIFVCNNRPRTLMKELHLSPPSPGFGEYVHGLAKQMDQSRIYSVLEDRCTVPDDVRVFVGYESAGAGLLGIETFMNGAKS
jgi:hypothetical protein